MPPPSATVATAPPGTETLLSPGGVAPMRVGPPSRRSANAPSLAGLLLPPKLCCERNYRGPAISLLGFWVAIVPLRRIA